MKLSDQALTCIMVALQKSIMEQNDIVPMLKGYEIYTKDDELYVKNPPTLMTIQK